MTRVDIKKAGAGFALLLSLLLGFEGVRQVAYRDVAGVPTICVGHTEGVRMGMTATEQMCRDLLSDDAYTFWEAVDGAVKSDMSPWQWAAWTSFAFNMGVGAFNGSTLLRLANEGKIEAACRELPKWNKAKRGPGGPKVPLRGLTKRRSVEMFTCLGYIFDEEFSPNHRTHKPILR